MATKKNTAASAIADVFGAAAAVPSPAKKKGGKTKETVEMDKPFDTLIKATLAVKALEGVVDQLADQFKGVAFAAFKDAISSGAAPEATSLTSHSATVPDRGTRALLA